MGIDQDSGGRGFEKWYAAPLERIEAADHQKTRAMGIKSMENNLPPVR